MGIMRLILALSVVAVHCNGIFGLHYVNGQVSVQSFYIISGFYMSMILNEKYIGKSGSYKLFITNRLLRLYPIYWTVLLLSVSSFVTVALVKGLPSAPIIETYMSIKHTFISVFVMAFTNIFIVGADAIMFVWLNPATGLFSFTSNFWATNPATYTLLFIPPVWTVGLEILFYLIAPFIVRRKFKVVFYLFLLSICLRLFMFNGLSLKQDPWSARFFPLELMFFFMGYFSYKFYCIIKNKDIPKRTSLAIFFYIISFSLLYSFLPEIRFSWLPFSVKEIGYFSSFTLAIPFIFKYFKSSAIDMKLGDLSYPIYISHIFMIFVCQSFKVDLLSTGTSIAIATILFSILLNRYISNPIEKYRQGRVVRTQ